jgi:hypothetical protein
LTRVEAPNDLIEVWAATVGENAEFNAVAEAVL